MLLSIRAAIYANFSNLAPLHEFYVQFLPIFIVFSPFGAMAFVNYLIDFKYRNRRNLPPYTRKQPSWEQSIIC
jgi:hypothetical protein